MNKVKDMSVLADAEAVLARVARAQDGKKPRVTGLDGYYQLLLEDGYLPGNVASFPNRALIRELYADMVERVVDLRFVPLRALGVYLGRKREVGIAMLHTAIGNAWVFPRLCVLRRDWELRQGGWRWPSVGEDWVFNPRRYVDRTK
jgi:hypothetical protein